MNMKSEQSQKNNEIIIDFGSGSYPLGNIAVDIQFGYATSAPHLESTLRKYGLRHHPDAKRVYWDLNKFPYPFPDNYADKAVLCHVLEHLHCPLRVLQEIKRILKPKGKLIIVIPNPRKNDADRIDKSHLYSWTIWALENILKHVGFKIIEIKEIAGGLDILAVAEKP